MPSIKRVIPVVLSLVLCSCMPAVQVQGPAGPRTVRYQSTFSLLSFQRVPVDELTDATPADAYVSFPYCDEVISVADVRALGVVGGQAACDAAREQAGQARAATQVLLFIGGAPVLYLIYKILTGMANSPS